VKGPVLQIHLKAFKIQVTV